MAVNGYQSPATYGLLQFGQPATGGGDPYVAAQMQTATQPVFTGQMGPRGRNYSQAPAPATPEPRRFGGGSAANEAHRAAIAQDNAMRQAMRTDIAGNRYMDNYLSRYATSAVNNIPFQAPNMNGRAADYFQANAGPTQSQLAQAVAALQQQYQGQGWGQYPGLNLAAGVRPEITGYNPFAPPQQQTGNQQGGMLSRYTGPLLR